MAGETVIVGLVAGTIVLTLFLLVRYPRAMRAYFFDPIEQGRLIIGLIILVVGAWTLLNSGVPYLMAFALVGVAFVTAYVYIEEPHQEIR